MASLSPNSGLLRDLPTPCLVVDGEALRRNIEGMAATAREAGVALRPHAKTHKSPEIAKLQMRAGAVGIACATVTEAEELARAGLPGLLLTSPIMGASKFTRIAGLNRQHGLTVVVDHAAQVEALCAAVQPGDRRLNVAVDVDVGQARTGVADIAAGVALARTIAQQPALAFAGIQGFAGHAQHLIDPAERRAAGERAAGVLRALAKALTEASLAPALITGSGTGTHRLDAASIYNELQVGSYVFMDADYARIADEHGEALTFAPSLFVLASVVSVNRPGQVTVDAGTKALATNGPPPCMIIGAPSGARYAFAGDEHGIIFIPRDERTPELGARVLIGATHCDPTVNLHASLHVVAGGELTQWPIVGRYGD
ncbi:MAG TPA: DSD1 family PLP-dependent enzyme [Pseudolabrys sp.]|nr:DSD1 family PLP-dependent enzyme [Pseudolabrys sp.]